MNRYAACKYLMRNDGALATDERESHDPRKERSIEIVFELCEELSLEGPLKFMRELQSRGEKIDDICDALLLAIQDQLDCMTEEARQLIRDARALIKCIPVTPTVKKRQRKTLLKALTEAEITERTEKGLPLADPVSVSKKAALAHARQLRQKNPPQPRRERRPRNAHERLWTTSPRSQCSTHSKRGATTTMTA